MFQRRVIEEHDEEESIFISMTDLSVSMLLLLVILLGFFASQYRQATVIEQEAVTAAQVASLRMEISALERRLADADPSGILRQTLQQRLAQEAAEVARLRESLAQSLDEAEAQQLQAERERILAAQSAALIAQEREDARAEALLLQRQIADALAARDAAAQTLEREVTLREDMIASLRLDIAALERRLVDADPSGAIRAALERRIAGLEQSLAAAEALRLEAEGGRVLTEEVAARLTRERDEARAEASLLQRQVAELAAARDAAIEDFLREAELRNVQARQLEALQLELEANLVPERDRAAAELATLRDRVAILEGTGDANVRRFASDLSDAYDVIAARDAALSASQSRARALDDALRNAAAEAQALRQQLEDQDATAQAQRRDSQSPAQDAAALRERIAAQDLEIAELRSQVAALEGLLDALMRATTSTLEKLTPPAGDTRNRD